MNKPNPYSAPHTLALAKDEASTEPLAIRKPIGVRSFLRYYWNPCVATVAMISFYVPFIANLFGGNEWFRATFAFAATGMLTLTLTWLIAILQLTIAMAGAIKKTGKWKHHALASIWSFGYYLVWVYLATKGCYLAM